MAHRWMVTALFSLGLLMPGQVFAQLPSFAPGQIPPYHPAAMAEPTPISTMPNYGGANQKSLTAAPPVTLTNDGTPNAFADECQNCVISGFFMSAGAIGLERQDVGNTIFAVRNNGNGETGTLPVGTAMPIIDLNQVGTVMNWGPRLSFGYQYGPDIVELNAYYLPGDGRTNIVNDPTRIDTAFANGGVPIGFNGNNNLFLQADQVVLQLETEVLNVEANYRFASGCGIEWIFGIRYFDLREEYGIFVSDDHVVGLNTADRQALYNSETQNHLLMAQFGFEGEWPIHQWLAIGLLWKGAWGPNFHTTDILLTRGDGFVSPNGPNARRSDTRFSQLYEFNLFADLLITDRMRLRGGYQALWVLSVTEAVDQIDFNLLNPNGNMNNNSGSVFFHGPMVEFHFAF